MNRIFYLLIFTIVSVSTAQAADKPIAKYNGKPLTHWLERIEKMEAEKEQQEAADAVADFGAYAAPAVPRLLEMLDDRSVRFRAMIGNVLIRLGPVARSAAPKLMQTLKDKDKAVDERALAIKIMLSVSPGEKELGPVLIGLLNDADLTIDALRGLSQLKPAPKEAVPAIIRLIHTTTDEYVAGEAIEELAKLSPPPKEFVALLEKCLQKPMLAGRALPHLISLGAGAKDVLPAIRQSLEVARRHDFREIPVEVVRKLYVFGQAAVPVLLDFLGDDACKDGRYADLREVKFGKYAISSRTYYALECHAAAALGELGPAAKEATPQLRKLLKPKCWLVRICAVDALWKIEKDVSIVPSLIGFVEEQSDARLPAAELLGEIGTDAKAALPALRKALETGDYNARTVIREAIMKIEGQKRPIE